MAQLTGGKYDLLKGEGDAAETYFTQAEVDAATSGILPSVPLATVSPALPNDSQLRKDLLGSWKGEISNSNGYFDFTLSFEEDGRFHGDGNFIYQGVPFQSMIDGGWGIQGGHIHTHGNRKTTGNIPTPSGYEAIGKAYNEDKTIVAINDKILVFTVPDSQSGSTISLNKVSPGP